MSSTRSLTLSTEGASGRRRAKDRSRAVSRAPICAASEARCSCPRSSLPGKRRLQALQIAEHDCQEVVEVVSDTARELAERLHALRLDEGCLRLLTAPAFLHQRLGALGDARLELLVALGEKRLRPLSLGHVAQDDEVYAFVVLRELGNGGFGGKLAAVLAQRKNLTSLAHAPRRHPGGGEGAHVRAVARPEALRDEQVEAASDQLVLGVTENRHGPIIELRDAHVGIEGNDGVGRDLEDGCDFRVAAPELLLDRCRTQVGCIGVSVRHGFHDN